MPDVRVRGVQSNVDTFMQVDPSYDALRASLRPYETQTDPQGPSGGHYFISQQTGTMSAGIGSAAQVFQVRWGDATRVFVLKKLKMSFLTLTGFAATSAGVPLQLFIGHGSTANGSGGTSIGVSSGKGRAGHNASAFGTSGEIRISSTAALTAATGQSLESQPIGGIAGPSQATNTIAQEQYLFDNRDWGDHPLILVANDTLAVTTLNPGATGTWIMIVQMVWAESVTF